MNILLNGKEQETAENVSLKDLLIKQGFDLQNVVVALNMECIPKEKLETQRVHENDEIEVLSPMFGG